MTDTVNVPRERVEAFLSAWVSRSGNGNIIYGMGMENDVLELTVSDLRAMLVSAPKAEPVDAETAMVNEMNRESDYKAMTVIADYLRDNPAHPYSGRQCSEHVQFARDALYARPEAPKAEPVGVRGGKGLWPENDTSEAPKVEPASDKFDVLPLGTPVEVDFKEAEAGRQTLYVAGVVYGKLGMLAPEYWLSETWPVKCLGDVSTDWKRNMFSSQPEAPKVEQGLRQSLVNFDVEEYVDGYELRSDEGDYTPNEKERLLITDAIHGVISELCQSHPAPSSVELLEARARIAELEAKLNTPEVEDFASAVVSEAQHQRERWPSENDEGKTPLDWFWLIGYLSQKAAAAQMAGDDFKALHHTISTAAALANWHAAISEDHTAMRPGIATPSFDKHKGPQS